MTDTIPGVQSGSGQADQKTKDDLEAAERLAKEHEEFLYRISHDFKAPLRHIKAFTNLLVETQIDRLDEEGREFASHIISAATKIDRMHHAITTLSQVTRSIEERQSVDSRDLVGIALAQLTQEIEASDADIQIGALPVVVLDTEQYEQVFKNLISNAIMYRSAARDLKISIDAKQSAHETVFWVEDNGIGMSEAQVDIAFKLFKHVDPDLDEERVGVGLPLAQKIVEHHGGALTIHSEPDVGTKVEFTLPTQR